MIRLLIDQPEIGSLAETSFGGMPYNECLSAILGNDVNIDCHSIEPMVDREEQKAIEALGGSLFGKHQPVKPIYIGDTQGDMESSQKANVDFGYAKYGFGHVDAPDISFENFKQIVNFFSKTRTINLSFSRIRKLSPAVLMI